MKYGRYISVILAALVSVTALVSPLAAQQPMTPQEKRFIDGLLKRGLFSLADAYLQKLLDNDVEPSMVNAQRVVVLEAQALRLGEEAAREKKFAEAAESYEAAIKQLGERMAEVGDVPARDQLRFEQFRLRVAYGEMLWQKHANNQLTIMEITDGASGDREKVQQLLRKAIEIFKATHADASTWYDEMERHPDFARRYSELYNQIDIVKAYSLYQIAWASYYLAFAMPADAEGRGALLDDAVTKFSVYADTDGDSEARYQSLKGRGMCYRLKGESEKAVTDLRKALELSKDENFNITVYYELAQTHLAARQYSQAQAALQELRSRNYAAMPGSFIGGQLMPFLDAKILLAEGAGDASKRDQAMVMLRDLWRKGDFWQLLVKAEVGKHIAEDADVSKMTGLELWVLADKAYSDDKLERAAELFAKYLEVTDAADPTYQEAQFNIAACYAKLSEDESDSARKKVLMKKAADAFRAVAEKFPQSAVADSAAEMYVSFYAELFSLYKEEEEAIRAYADALSWTIANRPKIAAAGDMQFYYAGMLSELGEYRRASREFEKVPAGSPNYKTAAFLAMDMSREYLRENMQKLNQTDLKREVDVAVTKTERFVRAVESSADATDDERRRAAEAMLISAEILSRPQVKQFERARVIVENFEKKYSQYEELLGEALVVKVDCLVGMNMTEEAMRQLDQIMSKVEDPMPILQSLFRSMTEDIERLNSTFQHKEAAERLVQANDIADRLRKQLTAKNLDPNGDRDAAIRYEMAMLHMNAGKVAEAVEMLDELCYRPYKKLDRDDTPQIDVQHLKGLATASQKLAADTRDSAQAYDLYQRAAYYWRNIANSMGSAMQSAVADANRQNDPVKKADFQKLADSTRRTHWEARLEEMLVYEKLHDLEKKHGGDEAKDYYGMIRKFMAFEQSLKSDFGGPALKIKFEDLLRRIGR